jgi:NodT family efflux transporter outer membrane factor (OMF) lipoprotein
MLKQALLAFAAFFHVIAVGHRTDRGSKHMYSESGPSSPSHRLALVVGSAILLAGCAVGPDFSRPDAQAPSDYTAEQLDLQVRAGAEAEQSLAIGTRISGDWWQLFHSKQLDEVLNQAIAGNQDLATAQATLAQARSAIDQSAGALWPHVQMTGGVSRQQTNDSSSGFDSIHEDFSLYTIGPNVSYALDIFGLNRRQVEQSRALAEAQEYQLAAAYLTLCGNVVNQAIAIASVRAQISILNEIIADDEQNVKNVSDLLSGGEATRTDVEQTRSQLDADRALLPPLQQQLSVAKHAMAILVGKAPSLWAAPDFDLAEFTLPPELPVSVPSELVHQRPDILSAEAQLHAASAAIGVATAQMYPQINLSATLNQQIINPENLFTGAGTIWSIAAQLTAPVFQGGTLLAQKRGAVNAFNAKAASYKQAVLLSFGQVADTLTAIENDAQLADRERSASDSAGTTRQLTEETFRGGGITVLQVVDSERQYAQARLAYTKAQAQRFVDSAQLFNAMGGGWWDWRAKDSEASAQVLSISASKP